MRALVTGTGSRVGGRVAANLAVRPDVDAVVGIDATDPVVPVPHVEIVHASPGYGLLQRLLAATAVDTVVHALVALDGTHRPPREAQEDNVIATMNLLAACAAPGSRVRRLVVLSSTSVYGTSTNAPYFLREDDVRADVELTPLERSLRERESWARDFAGDRPDVGVTILRAADLVGRDAEGPLAAVLRRPLLPEVLGFDPRVQVVHEDDVVDALLLALRRDLPGTFNVAGEGTLPWSDVCTIVGRRRVPLPPAFASLPASALRWAGVVDVTPEVLGLLKWGRAVDTARVASAGFRPRFTSAGAVDDLAREVRLARSTGHAAAPYRYAREVEEFFRHSRAVIRRT